MNAPIVLALFALAAHAQNVIVSPALATTQGGTGNIFPWLTMGMRYIQVHSVLKGTLRTIHQISFRMPPGNALFTGCRWQSETDPSGSRNLTNPAPGAILHAQAHSLDAGSPWSIPVANSDGARITLPNLAPTVVNEVTRLYVAGTASPPIAFVDHRTAIGFGLATQFHY